MQKIVVALALLLAASTVSYAQVKPTRIGAVDFPDGSAIGVSAAGRARLRYHLANNRLEVSLNGAAYAALGGGGGSVDGLKAAYEAASSAAQNRLLLTAGLGWPEIRDNATPLQTSFRVTDSTGSWWRFYVNRYGFGSFPEAATGTVFPVMELSPPDHTALTASTELPAFYFRPATWQWSTGALTMQRWFAIEAPTLSFVGASTLADAATVAISGAPVAGTNATLTRAHALWVQSGQSTFQRDALATTTANGVVLQNTTAATGGATVQVSPSLAFESNFWNGASSTLHGVGLYHKPSSSGPRLYVRLKNDGGAYGDIGWFGFGYLASGFGIGDAGGANWLDFGGAASGANALRVVAAGFSHSVFDGGGFYPYSDLGIPLGKSTNRYSAVHARTYFVGNAGGAGNAGTGILSISNAVTVPATDPTGGGYLYVEGGALKFRGSSGTITTIAPP
jgi:hypothetical protein